MAWLLANVDVFKVTSIALALAFYFFDLIFKWALGLFPETAGADLCLVAVTLDASILIDRFNKVTQIPAPILDALRAELHVSFLLFVIGLVLWGMCLCLADLSRKARPIIPRTSFAAFLLSCLACLIGAGFSTLVILLFVEV